MPALTGLWVGDGGVTRHGRAGWLHLPGGENDTAEPIRCHFQALRQPAGVKQRTAALCASVTACVRHFRLAAAGAPCPSECGRPGRGSLRVPGWCRCSSVVLVLPASPGPGESRVTGRAEPWRPAGSFPGLR